tara:strand:+ start:2008 stop:3000 length:993 start_codon:yes stop_codon:yes gene_type:complete
MMNRLKKALEALESSDLDQIDMARTRALLKAYDHHYGHIDLKATAVEQQVAVELHRSPWKFVGAIDTLCRDGSGNNVMVEHKTTSLDVSNLSSPYFTTLSFNLQISAYHMAQELLGDPISQTVYDVVRKPTTKPKAIPRGSEGRLGTRSEIEECGTYYGHSVPVDSENIPDFETFELYEHRLMHMFIADKEKYFVRYGQIRRSRNDIIDTYEFLNDMVEDIERCRERNVWHMNGSSCQQYGSSCEYLSLCRGVDSPDSDAWVKREGSSLSGSENLSCSRIRCFQSCPRKHYWRYEYGIERRRERSQALRVGSAFHLAMEAWWGIEVKEAV